MERDRGGNNDHSRWKLDSDYHPGCLELIANLNLHLSIMSIESIYVTLMLALSKGRKLVALKTWQWLLIRRLARQVRKNEISTVF